MAPPLRPPPPGARPGARAQGGAWAASLRRAVARRLRSAVGSLLPCPACGVRPAGAEGCCPVCRATALRPGRERQALWLGPYAGALGRTVRALKYRGALRPLPWLAAALAAEVRRAGWRPDVVCAVPLHPRRRRERGFDQAALLAGALADALRLPYRPLLRRVRPTPPQARLGRSARAANVAGAFTARPAAGKAVLLVDDVLTTGATVEACAAALKARGAVSVCVAVVARSGTPAAPGAAGAVAPRKGVPASFRPRASDEAR